MGRLSDPDELRSAGRRLQREADDLGEHRRDLRSEVADLQWEGRSGERFRGRAGRRGSQLERVVDDLRDAARRLDRAADANEAEARFLRRAERDIESLRAQLEPEVFEQLLVSAGVPPALPPSGDTDWRVVHDAITRSEPRPAPRTGGARAPSATAV